MSRSQKHWLKAVMLAIEAQRHDILSQLIKIDEFDINEKDKLGWAPISLAANLGDEECLKILLKRKDIDVNLKDSDGWTPIMYFLLIGSIDGVRMLLKHRCIDVLATNNRGDECIDIAKRYASENLVKLMEKKCRQIA